MFEKTGYQEETVILSELELGRQLWIETECGCIYQLIKQEKDVFKLNNVNGHIKSTTGQLCRKRGSIIKVLHTGSSIYLRTKNKYLVIGKIHTMATPAKKCVIVKTTTKINRPCNQVLSFIHQIKYLAQYELKVDVAKVFKSNKSEGEYRILGGTFAFIPWTGKFYYRNTQQGFRSHIVEGGYDTEVHGGFCVKRLTKNTSQITHDEVFCFSTWLTPALPLFAAYIKYSQKKELEIIKQLVEAKQ
jgi:hypothetical protein